MVDNKLREKLLRETYKRLIEEQKSNLELLKHYSILLKKYMNLKNKK